jgi:hypothetical protein
MTTHGNHTILEGHQIQTDAPEEVKAMLAGTIFLPFVGFNLNHPIAPSILQALTLDALKEAIDWVEGRS